MTILINIFNGNQEIGFLSKEVAEKFVSMVFIYANELQTNKDKYVMGYISEIVKLAFKRNLITLDDLYTKKESEIVAILNNNFYSWKYFNVASSLVNTDEEPNGFFISFDTKKRNTIPLVKASNGAMRITNISNNSIEIYSELENYKDTKYAYIETIKNCK